MGLKDWLLRFKAQHQLARAGNLDEDGWASYRAGREELARALMAAQRASLRPGESARLSLRAACAVQADLEWSVEKVRAVTVDVSAGGFAATLARAPAATERIRAALRLPGGTPVSAECRVVSVQPLPAAVRASFAFTEITPADRERVEMVVFDVVLSKLTI